MHMRVYMRVSVRLCVRVRACVRLCVFLESRPESWHAIGLEGSYLACNWLIFVPTARGSRIFCLQIPPYRHLLSRL